MTLFEQLELVPTIAMHAGTQHLFLCRMCGSLLCVPANTGRSSLVRQVTRELGSCPRCQKRDWSLIQIGEGPFQWRNGDDR